MPHSSPDTPDINMEMVIFLQWMTLNCGSNSELAILSNVCKAWRKIVFKALCRSIKKKSPVSSLLLPCMVQELIARRTSNAAAMNSTDNESGCAQISSPAVEDRSTFCLAWFPPKGIQIDSVTVGDDSSISSNSGDEGNLFAHHGHNKTNRKMMVSGNISSFVSPPLKLPTHGFSRRMGMGMGSTFNDAGGGANSSIDSRRQTVAKAWYGYKDAMDVLIPFGYTNDFVTRVISKAIEINSKTLVTSVESPPTASSVSSPDEIEELLHVSAKSSDTTDSAKGSFRGTTFAVRGSTEARPVGIPWDDDILHDVRHLLDKNEFNKTTTEKGFFANSDVSDIINGNDKMKEIKKNENNNQNKSDMDWKQQLNERRARRQYQQDYDMSRQKQKLKKIKKKIKDIKQSLPRLVLSSNEKNPRHHLHHNVRPNSQNRFLWSNGNGNQYFSNRNSYNPIRNLVVRERRQRSVQFINADDTRAVRMQTRPFECGPVPTPITVFCVGIATEDGSFLSGLRKRLELGHLYPKDKRDEMTDMSAICLGIGVDKEESESKSKEDVDVNAGNANANANEATTKQTSSNGGYTSSTGTGTGTGTARSPSSSYRKLYNTIISEKEGSSFEENGDDDNDNDSYSSSCDEDSDDEKGDSSNEFLTESERQPPIIIRGKTGPGRWHCYTAIFDDEESLLRVDGLMEQNVENNNKQQQLKRRPSNANENEKPIRALLDGLTIGSDHRFDMSLCFGGGDPGEGEGAISEVAVFKGRLPISDLVVMEAYLMSKHGIKQAIPPLPQRVVNKRIPISSWQEDEWNRQAHALIQQYPPYSSFGGDRVPLGFLAKHRSVAWYRKNDVTGAVMRVSRIGSKYSTGSSDW